MALTKHGQFEFRIVEETTKGTTPSDPALTVLSSVTRRATPRATKTEVDSRDIGDWDRAASTGVKNEYEVEVEYTLSRTTDLNDFVERQSDGTPRAYTLELISNVDGTAVYQRGQGFNPGEITVNGAIDEPYVATVLFQGGILNAPTTTDPGIGTGSREAVTSVSEGIKTFAGGDVDKAGAEWATLVNNATATVNHGVEPAYDAASQDPDNTVSLVGNREITGTADLTYDDAGDAFFDDTTNLTAENINILFESGATPAKWQITNATFPGWEWEGNTDDTTVFAARDFEGDGITTVD